MTREQTLALVEALLESTRVHSNLSAILGYGLVPSMDDFDSVDAEAADRCESLIEHLRDVVGVLRVLQDTRPRQKSIPFVEEISSPSKKEEKEPSRWDYSEKREYHEPGEIADPGDSAPKARRRRTSKKRR